jgi:predicted nucleic acid-binding protein
MERSTALVIDASVALKWFVPEPDSSEALKIRDLHTNEEISLFAPDLLPLEIANALRYKSTISNADLKTSIESLFELDLAFIRPSVDSVSRTANLARTLDLTVYDVTYLELAEALDCQLVTSDTVFYEKASANKSTESVRIKLLKDYSAEQKDEETNTEKHMD